MSDLHASLREAILALGPRIRYVAFGAGQQVETEQREGLADASAGSWAS